MALQQFANSALRATDTHVQHATIWQYMYIISESVTYLCKNKHMHACLYIYLQKHVFLWVPAVVGKQLTECTFNMVVTARLCMCIYGIPPLWFYLGFKHFHLTAAILQRKAFANAASCVVDLKVIMQFNISALQYGISYQK